MSAESKAARGDYLLVYVTPEKLATSGFRQTFLQQLKASSRGVGLVAVDEAHCVSYGRQFESNSWHKAYNKNLVS